MLGFLEHIQRLLAVQRGQVFHVGMHVVDARRREIDRACRVRLHIVVIDAGSALLQRSIADTGVGGHPLEVMQGAQKRHVF